MNSIKSIHLAKAKYEKVKQMSLSQKQATELPERPSSVKLKFAETKSDIMKPTAASAARSNSPEDVAKQEEVRKGTGAHQSYVPGGDGAAHVKGKSYGHVASQPRATPSWRRFPIIT